MDERCDFPSLLPDAAKLFCWRCTENTKHGPLWIKRDKTLSQRWFYWNSWHNVFVLKGGNVLLGSSSLVFLWGLDVLWLSRSNCFSYPARRGEDSIHCALWHRASRPFSAMIFCVMQRCYKRTCKHRLVFTEVTHSSKHDGTKLIIWMVKSICYTMLYFIMH